jgi:hypothetical protein
MVECLERFGLTGGLARPNALLEQIWNTLRRSAWRLHGARRGYTGGDALMHWRRFCACLEVLPADRAEHVWRTVSAEMTKLGHDLDTNS